MNDVAELTNAKAADALARLPAYHELTMAELKAMAIWDLNAMAAYLQLPQSTLQMLLEEHPCDDLFLMGRRRFIRQEDALAWVDMVAARNPYTPRRNNRQK
jgi:hypothetical protein